VEIETQQAIGENCWVYVLADAYMGIDQQYPISETPILARLRFKQKEKKVIKQQPVEWVTTSTTTTASTRTTRTVEKGKRPPLKFEKRAEERKEEGGEEEKKESSGRVDDRDDGVCSTARTGSDLRNENRGGGGGGSRGNRGNGRNRGGRGSRGDGRSGRFTWTADSS
jgi:uncharacterized membrane protein YgcG